MGDSAVDSPEFHNTDQKGDAVGRVAALEVSVSFGRFASDSLSWEKWSSFSPNKYLEEVEKCSTPGSVAQKAAYFEAHYKKIAARKAELLDQEKQMNCGPMRLEEQNSPDLFMNNNVTEAEYDLIGSGKSFEAVEQEIHSTDIAGSVVSSTLIEEDPIEDTATTEECQISSVEGTKEGSDNRPVSRKFQKPDEPDSLKEETYSVGSHGVTEHSKDWDAEIGNTSKVKVESVRLDPPKEPIKKNSATKGGNMAKVKKKSASPTPRSSQILTPRVSKSVSSSTVTSTSRSSTRKVNGLSVPGSNNSSALESKRAVPPTSLHMSISLASKNSADSASLTTARRSSLMEKMGDKEIVKRAFKSFQSSYNQPKVSGEERSTTKQVSSTKVTESRVSPSMCSRKENERSLKASVGTTPSFGLRSDERAEKRKEFLKKLEEKSNAKEVERLRLRSKSKEEKEAEIKKIRQSLNFKATPMPNFYHGKRSSKSSLHKGIKNET